MPYTIISNASANGYISLDSADNTLIGQSFNGNGGHLDSCSFGLKKTGGSPTGAITAYLYAHSGTFGSSSIPTGSPLATSTNTIDASTILNTDGNSYTFNFDGTFTLVNGTKYVIVVGYSGGNSSNKLGVAVSTGNPVAGNESHFTSSWAVDSGFDCVFSVFGLVTAFTQSLTDSISPAETLSKFCTTAFTSAISLVEIFSRQTVSNRVLTDSITPTDVLTRLTTTFRSLADAISPVDTLAALKTYFRSFSDSITPSETFSFSVGRVMQFLDHVNINETLQKVITRSLTDAITPAEIFIKATTKSFKEAVRNSYILLQDGSYLLTANGKKIIAAGAGTFFPEFFTKSVTKQKTDAIAPSESFSRRVVAFRTLTDRVIIKEKFKIVIRLAMHTLKRTVARFRKRPSVFKP